MFAAPELFLIGQWGTRVLAPGSEAAEAAGGAQAPRDVCGGGQLFDWCAVATRAADGLPRCAARGESQCDQITQYWQRASPV